MSKRLHVVLPKAQWARLKALAMRTGLSMSEHVRRAIDRYLDARRHRRE